MTSKNSDQFSKDEADRRRDAVAKTMLKTPPKPRPTKTTKKSKA